MVFDFGHLEFISLHGAHIEHFVMNTDSLITGLTVKTKEKTHIKVRKRL